MNSQIKARGYVNLDFLGNLGLSIVKDKRPYLHRKRKHRKTVRCRSVHF